MIVADVISCADIEYLSGVVQGVLDCVVLIPVVSVSDNDDIGRAWAVVNEDNDVISGVDEEQLSGVVQGVLVCVVLISGVLCVSDNDDIDGVWGVVNEDNDRTVSVVVTSLVAFP